MRIVDACAHPPLSSTPELREHMPEPWRSRPVPEYGHAQYAFEHAELLAEATDVRVDREFVVDRLIVHRGVDVVVLIPLTRGLLPNVDLGSAICAATNAWLAQEWLADERFRGSIRVNPADPAAAVREIEAWAGHPGFVQVAVPTQSLHPYGQRMFFEIWQAAARHGLPVAIHSDGGAGADLPPTPVGYPRRMIEFAMLQPLNAAWHLASLIAEGVLERLPNLRIVCAEGGLEAMTPIFWRFDKDWRSNREEIPWTVKLPSRYVRDQVRFCAHRLDRPPGEALDRWLEVTGARELLMYASNFPQWDTAEPDLAIADAETGRRIMCENAEDLYMGAT